MSNKWLNCTGLLAFALLAACSESAVGDPCVPEAVPAGGFLPTEIYLETNSLQCATRYCLVDGLDGDPKNVEEDGCPLDPDPLGNEPSTCVSIAEIEESVYCSVRCDAPEDAGGVPTQKCPSGFICETVLATGGPGLQGSYCIKNKE